MTIALCDDELLFRKEVKHYLDLYSKKYEIHFQVKEFDSGEELLNCQDKFSLVFLDHEMKGLNGMDTARSLRQTGEDIVIVFLTSHPEIMQEAFEVKTFRYILKPVNYDTFEKCLDAARNEIEHNSIILSGGDMQKLINLKQIMYIEAGEKGTTIRTKDGSYSSKNTMAEWEHILSNDCFCRCHKAYYINLAYVDEIHTDYVSLYNQERVAVSRRCRKIFQLKLNQYIKRNSW